MPKYITASQYKKLTSIPRSKLSVRTKIFAGVIVEHENKIYLVRDIAGHFPGYDLPGGKVLWGEEIIECAQREFFEETKFETKLTGLLGVYQRKATEDEDDYIRFIFIGKIVKSKKKIISDPNIASSGWVDVKKVETNKIKLKSPETYREIKEYLQGKRYPLDVIETYVW